MPSPAIVRNEEAHHRNQYSVRCFRSAASIDRRAGHEPLDDREWGSASLRPTEPSRQRLTEVGSNGWRSGSQTVQSLLATAHTLERRLGAARERRAQAAAHMRTSKRMKGPRDSAARAAFKATRRRSAETAWARQVRLVDHALERVREESARFHLERRLGRTLDVDHARAAAPMLLRLDTTQLCAGARVLLRVALGLAARVWGLVLDEPTSELDLDRAPRGNTGSLPRRAAARDPR